ATVSGHETDPTPVNNTALVMSTVNASANLAVGVTADQSQVRTGDRLTYTATVKNNGPSDATGVTLTENLPSGVTIVSITPSQGSASPSGSVVTASLGDLPAGGTATLTIVVSPTVAGPSTDSVSVTANETDPDTSDNSSSVDVQFVEPPGTLQ